MKKSLIIPILLLGMGTLVIGATKVGANDNTHPFATRIAEHFNLNQDEVGEFILEMRQEKQAERKEQHQEHISSLIEQGVLTQAQADLLETYHQEMMAKKEANLEEWQNMSRDEKKAYMEEKRQEKQQWAEENGIDLSLLKPEKGFAEGKFRHRRR
jgi:hypothetical protein